MHSKTNKSKHRLISLMTAMVIVSVGATGILAGCGESDSTPDETKVVTETQIVTNVVEVTGTTDENGSTVSSENSSQKSDEIKNSEGSNSKSSESSSGSKSGSSKADSKTTSTNKENSSKTESSSKAESKPSSNSHKPVTDSNACSIDGSKFAVGDTVTCVYNLTSPEKLVNFQAYIKYDSKYLTVKSAELEGLASSSSIVNSKAKDRINFNGSNISRGYDYTKGGSFLTVTYEVKAAGATTTSFVWEVATGFSSDKAYVSGNKAAGGLKISKEFY